MNKKKINPPTISIPSPVLTASPTDGVGSCQAGWSLWCRQQRHRLFPGRFLGEFFFRDSGTNKKRGVVFFVGELIEQIRSHTVSYQEQKRFGWLVFNPPDGKHFLQGLGSKTFSPKSLEWNHLVSAKVNGSRRLEGSQKSGEGIFALVETMIVPSEILIYSIH